MLARVRLSDWPPRSGQYLHDWNAFMAHEHVSPNHSSDRSDEGTGTVPIKVILFVLVFAAFVMMLNETTLAVALPSIMDDYDITATTAQWLLTGFMLTMAVVMPATGWILERFSTRSVFIFATVIFLVGTIIAAIAPTFIIMLLARVAQAVGTAIIMPLLMTVTMTVVPIEIRGSVMGLISVVMAVAPALGPSVAGFVLNFTTWHGIFWVMVPLVFLAALVGIMWLTNVGETKKAPLDFLSVILSALAFGGLIFGVSSIGAIRIGGPTAELAIVLFITGLISLALFVWRQIALGRTDRALLDLRPLRYRNYTLSILVLLFLFGAMLGVLNTLPLYLQGSLLVTALTSGLVLLPGGLFEGFISPFVGRIYDRVGPRPLIIPGMILSVGTLFAFATVDENTSRGFIIALHVIFSGGLGLLFTPLMTTALSSVPRTLYSHGSAILNTLQQLAGAAGTAVMISIFDTVTAESLANGANEVVAQADGANSAFFASALTACVALVLSFFVTKPKQDIDVTELVAE